MNRKIYYFVCLSILGLFFLSGAGVSPLSAQSSTKIAVVVHKDNPIPTIEEGVVKLFYMRKVKKRWPQINKSIRPVDRSGNSAEKNTFLSKVLKMSEEEVEQYFIERKTANAEMPPVKLNSDNEIIDYVKNNIGAIGYINANSVNDMIKVILIVQ